MSERDDLLNIFWEEMGDYLATLNQHLLKAEMSSGVELGELLKEMNRIAHSMKGAARAVGLSLVETIAHYMEDIFQHAREQGHGIPPNAADTLYDGLDIIQNAMNRQETDAETIARVVQSLEALVLTQAAAAPLPEPEPVPVIAAPPTEEVAALPTEETLRVSVRKLDQLMVEVSELLVVKMRGDLRYKRLQELRRQLNRWQREWRSVRTAYIRLARRLSSVPSAWADDLGVLLRFLESNQRALAHTNRELHAIYQMLSADQLALASLTDVLQDRVSGLRMMPFETLFGALQRVTRDTARDLHKQAELVLQGGHVEIDKLVLDALKDPLLHLLRNALDHGIEPPNARLAAGKPAQGRVVIQAEGRGNELQIRISDDGRGIDIDKVRRRAVAQGLLTAAEADALDETGVFALLFQSGFTTSETVTAYSGRGLGMDIVKERVEALRGRISVSSVRGQGTTVSLSVPVSLTRLRCILLRVGGEEYAIPSIMVARMLLVPRDERFLARGVPMIILNNRPTPVTALADLLDAPSNPSGENAHILVLQTNERTVALEVDDLYNELELVLKPLGRELANAPFVAGAALLGSGEVVLVLDAHDLIRKASGDRLPRQRRLLTATTATPRRVRVLIVDDSITTRTLEKNILEAAGFIVSVATDGAEAWAMLQDDDALPDVLISDVEMPRMNGLELTQRVKNDPRTRDLPVLLLTSLSKPEQREAGLRVGADAYLVKSRFDQNELLQTIHSVLIERP